MSIPFPYALAPSGAVFMKATASRSGGRSLTGSEQVISTAGGGFWKASLSVPVHGEIGVLSYRALYASVDGSAGEILVPCFNRWRPRDMNGSEMHWASAAGTGFADNTGWGQTETVLMRTSAPAALRATSLAISHPHVPMLRPGHYFGIGERLHLVARSWMTAVEVPATTPGGELTYGADGLFYGPDGISYGEPGTTVITGENASVVHFWPPLREAVAADTPLILGRPVCRMRWTNQESAGLDLEMGVIGRPSLEFDEVI